MTGVDYIAAERKRQKEVEGWTPEHDAQHEEGELSVAAALYALNRLPDKNYEHDVIMRTQDGYARDAWPWDRAWDKRKKHDRLRSLAIAGALIAAEIDRLTDVATNP